VEAIPDMRTFEGARDWSQGAQLAPATARAVAPGHLQQAAARVELRNKREEAEDSGTQHRSFQRA